MVRGDFMMWWRVSRRVLGMLTLLFGLILTLSAPTLALAAGYASVSGGVSVSPSPVVIGQNFTISFSLKEVRGESKTFENVAIAILRSDNSFVFDFAMYSNVTIGAYGTWSRSATNYLYSTQPPGTCKAIIRGKYAGQWFDFDTTGSGVNPRSFSATAASPPPPTDDHGNSCSAATTVNVNSSRTGTIGSAGDWDYFRVQVPSSGTLTVYTTGSTDTYGFLKNSSCADIASNDDYNGNLNFRIVRSVTAGTYYVAVRHYSSTGTGAYTLVSTFTSANPFAAGTDAFVRARTGLCTDMDGVDGCQCVDLMQAYIQDVLGVPRANHSIRGNAYPIYANISGSVTISYGTRSVRLDKIARTSTGVPQKGDIVFWGPQVGGGYGHVAIFRSGDVNSFVSLDQNWGVNFNPDRGSPATQVTHDYTNVVGWLHPVLLSN